MIIFKNQLQKKHIACFSYVNQGTEEKNQRELLVYDLEEGFENLNLHQNFSSNDTISDKNDMKEKISLILMRLSKDNRRSLNVTESLGELQTAKNYCSKIHIEKLIILAEEFIDNATESSVNKLYLDILLDIIQSQGQDPLHYETYKKKLHEIVVFSSSKSNKRIWFENALKNFNKDKNQRNWDNTKQVCGIRKHSCPSTPNATLYFFLISLPVSCIILILTILNYSNKKD